MAEIVLPQSYLQRQAVSKKAGIFTFVTWSDVAERSIEFDEFRAQFASLHTENLIALISMISIIQTNTPSLHKVFQAQHCALIQQLCAPEIAEEIVRKINRGERDALTSEEQLLQAALFAILYSASGPAQDMPSKSVDELGEFLLKVNDVISNGDHGDGEKYSPIELFIKLSMRHHSRTLQEQPRYLLARYYDLLTLHGWYCDQSKEAMNAFTEFVGGLFQDYVTDLLVRVYSGATISDEHFYSEQDIRDASSNTSGDDRPPFDGLLHSNDNLVVFEITTESTPVTVLERGNPEEFIAPSDGAKGAASRRSTNTRFCSALTAYTRSKAAHN